MEEAAKTLDTLHPSQPPQADTTDGKDPASKQPLFYDNKTLYIYCPAELANEFIKFANSEFYGKQYIALKELMRTWQETRHLAYMQTELYEMKERIAEIENALMKLAGQKIEEKSQPIKTIAGELDGR